MLNCNPRELPIFKRAVLENEKASTIQTEEAIKNSAVLQDLDRVCGQVPLPADFHFVWKSFTIDKKIILFTYYHSETSYETARDFWLDYFARTGWSSSSDGVSFPRNIVATQGTYRVTIFYGGMGDRTNFSIDCELLSH
jgi:hypothetical protein